MANCTSFIMLLLLLVSHCVCLSGYGGVISHDEKPVTMVSDTNGPVPFWLDDIMCDGTETALSMCPHSMWGEHDCSPSDAAGLICSGNRQTLSDTPILQVNQKFFEFKKGEYRDRQHA